MPWALNFSTEVFDHSNPRSPRRNGPDEPSRLTQGRFEKNVHDFEKRNGLVDSSDEEEEDHRSGAARQAARFVVGAVASQHRLEAGREARRKAEVAERLAACVLTSVADFSSLGLLDTDLPDILSAVSSVSGAHTILLGANALTDAGLADIVLPFVWEAAGYLRCVSLISNLAITALSDTALTECYSGLVVAHVAEDGSEERPPIAPCLSLDLSGTAVSGPVVQLLLNATDEAVVAIKAAEERSVLTLDYLRQYKGLQASLVAAWPNDLTAGRDATGEGAETASSDDDGPQQLSEDGEDGTTELPEIQNRLEIKLPEPLSELNASGIVLGAKELEQMEKDEEDDDDDDDDDEDNDDEEGHSPPQTMWPVPYTESHMVDLRTDLLTEAQVEYPSSGFIIAHFSFMNQRCSLQPRSAPTFILAQAAKIEPEFLTHSNLGFKSANSDGLPALPPHLISQGYQTLWKSVSSGNLSVEQASGLSFGPGALTLEVKNTSSAPLLVAIQPGTIFQHVSWVFEQNLMVSRLIKLQLGPGESSGKLSIDAYGMNVMCACSTGRDMHLTEFWVDEKDHKYDQGTIWSFLLSKLPHCGLN